MSKRKLLLADDSETVQKVVNLTFELEGIEVITFGDGDSAMQQLSAVAPDVVLADVNMPGISGYEICQKIKENEATRATPVILLVGSFEPFDEEKAMQVGADDYLTKPFQSIRQLVSKVNELLSPGNKFDTNVNTFDKTLEMDEHRYSESDYSDPGMDDEMIQTTRAENSSYNEPEKFQNPPEQMEDPEGISKTQPLDADDWQDIYPAGQTAHSTEQTVYEPAEEFASVEDDKEPAVDYEPADFIDGEADRQSYAESVVETSDDRYSETGDDEFGHQPDDIDHFYKEPDYEEESETFEETDGESEQPQFEEPADFSETGAKSENSEDVSAAEDSEASLDSGTDRSEGSVSASFENEPEADSETAGEQFDMAQTPVPFLNFDELDLLELPYPDQRSEISHEPASEPESPKTEQQSVNEQTEENLEQVKKEVSQNTTGVNLSPEDIEAIADRVVEKLTARLKE